MFKLQRPDFQAIPQMTRSTTYEVAIPWSSLVRHMAQHVDDYKLDTDPDFQRPHVWTREKQISFVEFCLRGGTSGNRLYLNCPGWNRGRLDDYVLVDGKQRLCAALAFLNDEIPAFGYKHSEFGGVLRLTGPLFVWCVNDLSTRAEVLQWYLDLNTGGVVHTEDEISKVKVMLDAETSRTLAEVTPLPARLHAQLMKLPCDIHQGKKGDDAAYKRCLQLVKRDLAIQHGYAEFITFQPSPAGWRLIAGE
jgi:hypothetical protein